jgi:hypothetical protein
MSHDGKSKRRPRQPLDLGHFVFEELFDESSDSEDEETKEHKDNERDRTRERVFSIATETSGGRAVALRIEMEQTFMVAKGYWRFGIRAYTISGKYVLGQTPLSFVLKRAQCDKTIEDIRIYLQRKYQFRGYAYLLVTFVKAFFFPFYNSAIPGCDDGAPALQLPLGGSWQVARLSVLPTASVAKHFYTRQGFRRFDTEGFSKWLFWPLPLGESVVGPAGQSSIESMAPID